MEYPSGWYPMVGSRAGAWGGLPIRAMVRSVVLVQADAARLIRSISGEDLRTSALWCANNCHASDPPPYATCSPITPPKVPDWSQVPVLVLPDFAPPFFRHIEQRLMEGVPMGNGPARALGWVRFPHQRR
ncbi:MAG: hypothetical protein CK552_05905 [Actinobacteria bacterium]|nr:MAG: hypothetical protein CK552_05905 [Actinomycetota bacterium]